MKRGAVIGVLLESKALALRSKRPPEVQSALRLLRLTGPGFWTGPAERVHHGGWRGMPPSDRTLAPARPSACCGSGAPLMPLWLGSRAKISTGAVFRGIDRWGRLASTALSPQAVNLILKKRARLAGLDTIELSAHGLQSGYLSETVRRGIPLVEAMQQSQHRSVQQAASYDNEVERQLGRAARVT